MPTVKQAKAAHPLAPAVLRQLGGGAYAVSQAIDAANHGADSGFTGFTYYAETTAFYRRNRAAIVGALVDLADDMDQTATECVASFRCVSDCGVSRSTVDRFLSNIPARTRAEESDRDTLANALAWFALEEVGLAIVDAE